MDPEDESNNDSECITDDVDDTSLCNEEENEHDEDSGDYKVLSSVDSSDNDFDEEQDIKEEEEGYETRSEVAMSDEDRSTNSDRHVGATRGLRGNSLLESRPSRRNSGSPLSSRYRKQYILKLNFLFRDARFFLIKSNNSENIAIAKSKNVWATLPINKAKLTRAFHTSQNVILIFSAQASGKFSGFARLASGIDHGIPRVNWVLPPKMQHYVAGLFRLDWICKRELPFTAVSRMRNAWNDDKPVKIGRDGQEIEPTVAEELCRKFPRDENIDLNPILRKSKDAASKIAEQTHGDNVNRFDPFGVVSTHSKFSRGKYPLPFVPPSHLMVPPYAGLPYQPPVPRGPPRYYEPLSILPGFIENVTHPNLVYESKTRGRYYRKPYDRSERRHSPRSSSHHRHSSRDPRGGRRRY